MQQDQDVGKSFGAPVFIAAALSYSLPETKKYATNKLWNGSFFQPEIFLSESNPPEVFCKKVFLEISQNLQQNACEFWEISKSTFFDRTPLMAASVYP